LGPLERVNLNHWSTIIIIIIADMLVGYFAHSTSKATATLEIRVNQTKGSKYVAQIFRHFGLNSDVFQMHVFSGEQL
jgi:hypothetical protein